MLMSFAQALSGLSTASTGLEVVGNNLANLSTVGFKQSRGEFADVYAAALGGDRGLGSQVNTVAQQFTQGDFSTTNNMLDFAINGNGMFLLNDQAAGTGQVAYTRNGQFHFEPVAGTTTGERYVVNSNGDYLMGWAPGVATTTTPSVMRITTEIAPLATSTSEMKVNLDDRAGVPSLPFDPAAPAPGSYNWVVPQTIYSGVAGDTTAHTLNAYFVKTATPNTWEVYTAVDGGTAAGPQTLAFSPSGLLASGGSLTLTANLNATVTAGGVTTTTPVSLPISLSLANSTQFAAGFDARSNRQNGYGDGSLANMDLLPDGTIEGRYSNGQTQALGQVALATFVNPNGLRAVGDNRWVQTLASGTPSVGAPNSGGRGVVDGYSLEQSNVDVSAELINMITMQRNYQASAQAIKTQDQMLGTLAALR